MYYVSVMLQIPSPTLSLYMGEGSGASVHRLDRIKSNIRPPLGPESGFFFAMGVGLFSY